MMLQSYPQLRTSTHSPELELTIFGGLEYRSNHLDTNLESNMKFNWGSCFSADSQIGTVFQCRSDDSRVFDLSLVGVLRDRPGPNFQFRKFLCPRPCGHQVGPSGAVREDLTNLPLNSPFLMQTLVTGYVPHSIFALPGKSRVDLRQQLILSITP